MPDIFDDLLNASNAAGTALAERRRHAQSAHDATGTGERLGSNVKEGLWGLQGDMAGLVGADDARAEAKASVQASKLGRGASADSTGEEVLGSAIESSPMTLASFLPGGLLRIPASRVAAARVLAQARARGLSPDSPAVRRLATMAATKAGNTAFKAGMGTSMGALAMPDAHDEAKAAGLGDGAAALNALGAGVTEGAFTYMMPGGVEAAGMTRAAVPGLARTLGQGARRTGEAVAREGFEEGATEFAHIAREQALGVQDGPILSDQNMERMGMAAGAGSIMGPAFTAPTVAEDMARQLPQAIAPHLLAARLATAQPQMGAPAAPTEAAAQAPAGMDLDQALARMEAAAQVRRGVPQDFTPPTVMGETGGALPEQQPNDMAPGDAAGQIASLFQSLPPHAQQQVAQGVASLFQPQAAPTSDTKGITHGQEDQGQGQAAPLLTNQTATPAPAPAGKPVVAPSQTSSSKYPPALAAALAGLPPAKPGDALRKKAAQIQARAKAMVAGIPPGQPVSSTRDRNRRDKSMELMFQAADLFKQAEQKDMEADSSQRIPAAVPGAQTVTGPATAPAQSVTNSSGSVTNSSAFTVGQRVRFTRGKRHGVEGTVVGLAPGGRPILRSDDGKPMGGKLGMEPSSLEVVDEQARAVPGAEAATAGASQAPDQSAPQTGKVRAIRARSVLQPRGDGGDGSDRQGGRGPLPAGTVDPAAQPVEVPPSPVNTPVASRPSPTTPVVSGEAAVGTTQGRAATQPTPAQQEAARPAINPPSNARQDDRQAYAPPGPDDMGVGPTFDAGSRERINGFTLDEGMVSFVGDHKAASRAAGELAAFARDIEGPIPYRAMVFGTLNAEAAERLSRDSGIAVKPDSWLTMTAHDLRHAFKEHGDRAAEEARGQQPMTPALVAQVPLVPVSAWDFVSRGQDASGAPLLVLREPGGLVMADVVLRKGRRLVVRTVYKQKGDRGTVAKGETPVISTAYQSPSDAEVTNTAADGNGHPITDVGEKIGGARKDIAGKTGPKGARPKDEDNRPAWMRRYTIGQIVSSLTPGEEGRWSVRDAKSTDWQGRPRQIGRTTYATKEEAEADLPRIEARRNHVVRMVSRSADEAKEFGIYRKTGEDRVKLVKKGFQTADEAERYLDGNPTKIMEVQTSFGEEILAKTDKANRKGPERRQGDVSPQSFMDTFGFRGVEFGNWNSQAERQEVMNHAYDGLMDLAEVVGIPPKGISLNGELALAFGARGHGLAGARAHYEPKRAVINLTKMKGSGALAHEWWHAVDYYFARQDRGMSPTTTASGEKAFPTDSGDISSSTMTGSGMRPELKESFRALRDAITRKAVHYVEDTAKAEQFVKRSRDHLDEQLRKVRENLAKERQYGARKTPATPEHLAAWDAASDALLNGDPIPVEWKPSGKGWHNKWTNAHLDVLESIHKAVTGRSGRDADHNGVIDKIATNAKHYHQRVGMMKEAAEQKPQTKAVPTQYLTDAKEIDQGRSTDYWTTPTELTARAFSAYAEDTLQEQGRASGFLSFGSDNWRYALHQIRPFPEGDERAAINGAFRSFFQTVKTEETPQGTTRLYGPPRTPDEALGDDADASSATPTWDRLPKAMNGRQLPRGLADATESWDDAEQAARELFTYANTTGRRVVERRGIVYGTVTAEQAKRISEQAGKTVRAGAWLVMDDSSVRHATESHKNAKREASRGQEAIGSDYFARLVGINLDDAQVRPGTDAGSVVIEDQAGGVSVHLVVRDGGQLLLKTGYQKTKAGGGATGEAEASNAGDMPDSGGTPPANADDATTSGGQGNGKSYAPDRTTTDRDRIPVAPLPPAGDADVVVPKLRTILADLRAAMVKAGAGDPGLAVIAPTDTGGFYDEHTGLVALARHGDLDGAAHEVGHKIAHRFRLDQVDGETGMPSELAWFAPFGSEPPPELQGRDARDAYRRKEAWAEFIRAVAVNPDAAAAKAPAMAAVYEREVPVDVRDAMTAFGAAGRAFLALPPEARTQANIQGIEELISQGGMAAGFARMIALPDIMTAVHDAKGMAKVAALVRTLWRGRAVPDTAAAGRGADGKRISALTSSMSLGERLGFNWMNIYWPAYARWTEGWARRGVDADALKPEQNFRVLNRLLAGNDGRALEQAFGAGLVDARNRPVFDGGSTGERIRWRWLMDPLEQQARINPETGEVTERAHGPRLLKLINEAMAKGVEERTVAEADKLHRRASEQVERFIADVDAALEGDTDIEGINALVTTYETATKDQPGAAALRVELLRAAKNPGSGRADNVQTQTERYGRVVRNQAKAKAAWLSGIGAGIASDERQARQAMANRKAKGSPDEKALDEFLRRYRVWAHHLINLLAQKGVFSGEQAMKIIDSNEWTDPETGEVRNLYLDLHRLFEGESTSASVGGRFSGSTRTIANPLRNLIEATLNAVARGERNQAMLALVEPFRGGPDRREDLHDLGTMVPEEKVQEARARGGLVNGRKPYRVINNGVSEWWTFDPGIEAGLEAARDHQDGNLLVRLWGSITRVMRSAIVTHPSFIIRNVIRDLQSATITSETAKGLGITALMRGFGSLQTDDGKRSVAEMSRLGGSSFAGYIEGKDVLGGELAKELRRLRGIGIDTFSPQRLLELSERLGERVEQVNRRRETVSGWDEAKAQGMDDYNASLYAADKARGLIDFAEAGRYGRQINKVILFLNATQQGILRVARTLSLIYKRTAEGKTLPEKAVRLLTARAVVMTGLLGAVGVARRLLMDKDDEEAWRQQPSTTRDFHWLERVGNGVVAVPKEYTWGFLMSGGERLADFAIAQRRGDKKAMERAFEGYEQSFAGAIMPIRDMASLMGGFAPIIEAAMNRDSFVGRNIVPSWEEGVALDKRTVERASPVAKWLQGVIQVDARKIDHVLEGYGGNYARSAQQAADGPGAFLGGLTGMWKSDPGYQARDVQWVLKTATEQKKGSDGRVVSLRADLKKAYTLDGAARTAALAGARAKATKLRGEWETALAKP